jgi:hypothetical protein
MQVSPESQHDYTNRSRTLLGDKFLSPQQYLPYEKGLAEHVVNLKQLEHIHHITKLDRLPGNIFPLRSTALRSR